MPRPSARRAEEQVEEIRRIAMPLDGVDDLDPLLDRIGGAASSRSARPATAPPTSAAGGPTSPGA